MHFSTVNEFSAADKGWDGKTGVASDRGFVRGSVDKIISINNCFIRLM